MIASLNQLFKEQGYTLIQSSDATTIVKSKAGILIMTSIFVLIGGLTIYISLENNHGYAHFIGLLIIIIPFIYDTRRYPSLIKMDKTKQEITIRKGFFINSKFNFQQVDSVDVDEEVLSSDTSPFKEGNKDYIYAFHITIDKVRYKLMKIQYRRVKDEEVKTFVEFFGKVLNSKTKILRS